MDNNYTNTPQYQNWWLIDMKQMVRSYALSFIQSHPKPWPRGPEELADFMCEFDAVLIDLLEKMQQNYMDHLALCNRSVVWPIVTVRPPEAKP